MEAGPQLTQGEGEVISDDTTFRNDRYVLPELREMRQLIAAEEPAMRASSEVAVPAMPADDIPRSSAGPVPNPYFYWGTLEDPRALEFPVVYPGRPPRSFGVQIEEGVFASIRKDRVQANIDDRLLDANISARLPSVTYDPYHLQQRVQRYGSPS